MATYAIEFGQLGDSRPVPPITVRTTDPNVLARTVVAHARPHITPVLAAMGRPELADCLFRTTADRTAGELLHLDLVAAKGTAFLGARITVTPERVQRRRTKGWTSHGAKYVGRGTRWGNPWVVAQTPKGWAVNWAGSGAARPDWTARTNSQHAAHLMAVGLYREFAEQTIGYAVEARVMLAGKDLMCWCPEAMPCHADFLLELANGGES